MYALVGTDLNTWMVANAGDGIHTTVRRNNQPTPRLKHVIQEQFYRSIDAVWSLDWQC
jgi:hypothetical protein